ncbi:enoyl-CoA hydratase/isomerase family protein [Streptomyces sp. NPDC055140]
MDESSLRADPSRRASPGVRLSRRNGFVHVCLDRPPMNAFTTDMFEQLRTLMTNLGDVAEPEPVLVTGAGRMFSAGFDLKQADPGGSGATAAARACVASVRDHPAPVIAAVEGAAVGVGLLIAMSADILVVSRSARLRMPEVTMGVDSDVAPLRRFLPDPWIRRMCLTGEAVMAAELGLGHCAGATVCEPGACVAAAENLLAPLADIEASYLRRAKQRLTESLFNGCVD